MTLQGRDLKQGLSGSDVTQLHSALANMGLSVPEAERQVGAFGKGTQDAVAQFQAAHGIEPTGVVNVATAAALVQAADATSYTVFGTVASATSAAVSGLLLQLVDKNVGADVPLGGTTTDALGRYQLNVAISPATLKERHKTQPDLQVRVSAGSTFLAASQVKYNASTSERLDVALPADVSGLPSEHETLTGALAASYAGRLGALQESADRHDITFLANKTGWDARAVALAALADQFSQTTAPSKPAGDATAAGSIKPELYYALFRAGLPAEAEALYQANPKTVESIWQQAIRQGVIPATLASEVAGAVQTFQKLSAANSLIAKPSVGLSTLQELLQLSIGADSQRQQQFADLYTRYQDDLPTFWSAVQKAFGTATTQRLQLDGRLALMTVNNAPLIERLYNAEKQNPLTSVLDLARRGYYEASKWQPLLDGSVPPQIPGATPAEQSANYGELLATQVRLTFPTAVVADMVQRGVVPIPGTPDVATGVTTFLTANQGKFEIGIEPVEAYLARNSLTGTVAAPVVAQVKRLQRVYQITPNDKALTALLHNSLDSAYAIMRYDRAGFVGKFADAMGGSAIASQTYDKARQVHGAILNIVATYLTARRAPALGPRANGFVRKDKLHVQLSQNSPVIASPTLEALFGSMDFCGCKECRSILGPAAYLVDLLQFIDNPTPHNKNPQEVLLGRRPDLQFLPLTCENTNVPLPYVDLVNETLEYFVANSLSLANYPGHDTGSTVTSEELLASPQFVNDTAYSTLQSALFPPPLPFHRPLELLRLHFQKLGVPLHDAMEALRTDDALERANANAYGWRDILMEQIGFSRAESRLLTDSTLKLQDLYGYPSLSDAAVIMALSSVQGFSRRVGVSYDNLVSILQTRFINPNSILIARLERLHVPLTTLQALKNGSITPAAFLALLPAGLNLAEYGGDVMKWITDPINYTRIMGLITIANPSNSTDLCSAAALQLRYANPDNTANTLHAIDFVRLIRFIRLWRKLGLTIEQTDNIVASLYPAADLPTGGNDAQDLQLLDKGFLVLLPRVGFLFQVMSLLNLTAGRDLARLLACWALIGTAGNRSLYAAMFLTPILLQQDPAFADDGYGNILQDNTQTLFAHVPALRAAFNLTGAEFALIATALGFDKSTVLNLANVSAVYRRGWLARALRLSVVELFLLTQFTGLDPFAVLDPSPTPPAEPPVVRLIRLLQALGAASLRPVQALYLVWNQDISGKSAPADSSVTGLAQSLRGNFADVESRFTLVDDPNGDIAKSLMGLVYGTAATDFFFGLLNNSLKTAVAYGNPQPTLAPPILDASTGRLSYDDLRKQLTYGGVLDTTTLAAIHAAVTANGNYASLQAAVDNLSTANHKLVDPFFGTYPELLPLYAVYAASKDPPQAKRTVLLANFLPGLKQKRKQEQALAAITAAATADPSFAPALLKDASVLHAAANGALPAISDLTALETQGLSVQFFLTNNLAAAPDLTVAAAPALDYAPAGTNPLPPGQGGSPIAGIWSGYLTVPEDGFYNIAVTTDPGAAVALKIAGNPVTMVQAGGVWSNQSPISLTAGALTLIALTVSTVTQKLTVTWESTGLGWQVIPGTYLYSATLVDRFRATYVRFLKASALATDLSLTANEIAYVASNPDFFISGQGWLNTLAVSGNPDLPTAASLGDILTALLNFARIKKALSPRDERLLAVLQNPGLTLPSGAGALLTLTGWSQDSLDALLKQFFSNKQLANLSHVENLRRVYDAYAIVSTCGISATALIAAMINDPTALIVRDLQSALRALYVEADWLAVVKPINDTMRDQQRNALVAYILQQLGDQPATADINTPDRLFEYFLMDVEMEPCMETSRIRHALSSAQLFIERCVRNLEPDVSPLDIDATKWVWMKRFRVWQANREVFLWPENWLYLELRDDQSQFFRESMTELLQSDISEDAAEAAYLNYLTQLQEVAKLQQCGMYYVPSDPSTNSGEAAYVVARTAKTGGKYYFRQLKGGSWTPWQDMKLDIEDTPVTPFVWKERLLVFWFKILKQSAVDPSAAVPQPSGDPDLTGVKLGNVLPQPGSAQTQVTIQAALCWSEFYNGKWQPTKTSDLSQPTLITHCDPSGQNAFNRDDYQLQVGSYPPGNILVVSISRFGEQFGSDPPGFLLYNTHNAQALEVAVNAPAWGSIAWRSLLRSGNVNPNLADPPPTSADTFSISYLKREAIPTPHNVPGPCNNLLKTSIGERVVVPQHLPARADAWDAPFFFEDGKNVFYVTTQEAEVMISTYAGYGVLQSVANLPSGIISAFPPLVLKQPQIIHPGIGPIIVPTPPGVADPEAMKKFVKADDNIRTAIGNTAPVTYQGRKIGPSGSLIDGEAQQSA